jgi:hypothetical protein
MKLRIQLEEYEYEIVHKPGNLNAHAINTLEEANDL